MADRRLTIGIDIGGTDTKVGVVDAANAPLAWSRVPTLPDEPAAQLVERVYGAAADLLSQLGADERDVFAVGIGSPGVVDHSAGVVVRSPNLPLWNAVPLRALFTERFGKPANLENDANAAAWGEHVAGAGRGSRNMVLLTLGTGLGGGVVLDGQLVRGSHGIAGEMGHTILIIDGRRCGCGQQGCLEQYVSATALERRYRELLEGSSPNPDGGPIDGLSAKAIADALATDALAEKAWLGMCWHLAVACINLARLLDVDRVVIGGGVSNAGENLIKPVRAYYAIQDWKMSPARPTLAIATLGNKAGIVGSAALARPA